MWLLLLATASSCVQVRLRSANESYDQAAYAVAAKDYEYVLHSRLDKEAIEKVADCYRQMGNSVKTEYWYRKALRLSDEKPIWNLYLGEACMKNGKYDSAKVALSRYIEFNKDDYHAQRMLESCSNMQQYYRDTTLYTITPLRMNSPGVNYFAPAFYRSGILFSSDRAEKGLSRTKSDWTGNRYLDLFYVKKTDKGNWLDPEPLRGDVNGKFNEGPMVVTHDNSTMYFTRNDYIKNVAEKNQKNTNVLKIFRAEFQEGEWLLKGEMYFNNADYSSGHPAINRDGTVMYYVSDMPWGYGGTDIYMVRWEGGQQWSQPVNLGPTINTDGNEMFPFIWNDSTLYFASDGHLGMGGLDIFESKMVDGQWTKPQNLNYPINSSADDFSYIVDSLARSGYFSSNRNSQSDKIYSFVKVPPKLIVELDITDEKGVALNNIAVKITENQLRDTTVFTNASGVLRFPVRNNKQYSIRCSNPNYYTVIQDTSTTNMQYSSNILLQIPMKKVELNKAMIWDGIAFKKKEWMMKLTSGESLARLVTFLQDNPQLQVEVASYTDSRGTDSDNNDLTQRRAELVKQYLSAQGVRPDRITPRGYGETKLLNKCVNGILCLEEDHEVNNRIEITVRSIVTDTAAK